MPNRRSFRVIYLWRQERHEYTLQFHRVDYANGFCDALRRAGWTAWVEEVL